MIRIWNLSRSWGEFSLSNITLQAEPGGYIVILGPTGCGKTLLLETVAGIHRGYTGSIHIEGEDMARVPPYKRNIGFVYQKSMLFPNLSVAGNIAYGMKVRGKPRSKRHEHVSLLADLLKIRYLLNRDVSSLSGGEMQKVALARALAIEPRILLLDEPLSPLDQASKDSLLEELQNLHRQLGTTTLHVTHDHNIARQLADHIVLLRDGSVVQMGSVSEVFQHPINEFVANFVRAPNILHGTARPGNDENVEVSCNGFSMIVHADITGDVGVSIPPERIRLVTAKSARVGSNCLAGIIERIDKRSNIATVELRVGDSLVSATVERSELTDLVALGPDAAVYAEFDPDSVHVFPAARPDDVMRQ